MNDNVTDFVYFSQGAAQSLKDAVDEFIEEGNPLVGLANRMAQRMFQMAKYSHGQGQKIQVFHFPNDLL